jgi:serine/threonine protein kinase
MSTRPTLTFIKNLDNLIDDFVEAKNDDIDQLDIDPRKIKFGLYKGRKCIAKKLIPNSGELIINRIYHPNIIRSYEISNDWIYFPFYDNSVDLLKVIDMNLPISKIMLIHILYAIKHIHDNDLYYCDIKPDNIICFLNGDKDLNNKIMLIDFETSGYADGKINLIKKGSPGYNPPESLHNIPFDPFKFDIWSIGCLLTACLYKRLLNSSYPSDINDDHIDYHSYWMFRNFKNRNLIDFESNLELYSKLFAPNVPMDVKKQFNKIILSTLKYNPIDRVGISEILTKLDEIQFEFI